MSKWSLYLVSPFWEKYDYFLQCLGCFYQETWRGHMPRGKNQNSINTVLSTWFLVNFLLKKFGSNIFQFCSYRSQRTFQNHFNLDFQIWLVFLVPFLNFLKTQVKLPDAEFNVELIGTNFKSQKWKTKKLVCPFLIALFYFETTLTK